MLLITMLFFSSLAFTVLENAMSVIFLHRVAVRRRHFMLSALLPCGHILTLGVGLLFVTLVAGSLQAIGTDSVEVFGREWSLGGCSGFLLYLLGVAGEVFVPTSVYLVMPAGRLAVRHALIGAVTAGLLMFGAQVILEYERIERGAEISDAARLHDRICVRAASTPRRKRSRPTAGRSTLVTDRPDL